MQNTQNPKNTENEYLRGGMHEVVRSGSTVTRPAGVHTPSVHRALRHVRDQGFMGAPEPLSNDLDQGKEVVSFLRGEVCESIAESGSFSSDRALVSAARLLRQYHDATIGFTANPDDDWFLPARLPAEVICHGDFAPYNCVVNDDEVTGVFDFDTAHPGPRLWDVAYAVYRWVPLVAQTNPDCLGDILEQRRRLRLFCKEYGTDDVCKEYGTDDVQAVIDLAIERLKSMVNFITSRAAQGDEAFGRHIAEGHLDIYHADIEHIQHATTALQSVISRDDL